MIRREGEAQKFANYRRRIQTMYTIKNLKTGPSREWGDNGAYSCSLYCEGKRVALVNEYGDGGEMRIEWLDRKADHIEICDPVELDAAGIYFDKDKTPPTYKVTPDQHAMIKFLIGKTHDDYDGEPQQTSIDIHIETLVQEFEEMKQVKRWCRTQTVIRLKSHKSGEYVCYKRKYSPTIKAQLEKLHGDQIVEFVNERFQPIAAIA
jgi:hypothetical protein